MLVHLGISGSKDENVVNVVGATFSVAFSVFSAEFCAVDLRPSLRRTAGK